MSHAARAVIVADLGFGDAGKGQVTAALVERLGATVVVRAHGGAQAGHTVVSADGRRHTFSQIGAGALAPGGGVRTILARHMIVHPTALLVEARALEQKGVADPLGGVVVSERALVTTPFHQATCRLRELSRGGARHGSCGVGVGETARDEARDDVVRMDHLGDTGRLRVDLARLAERKRAEIADEMAALRGDPAAAREIDVLDHPKEIAEAWIDAVDVIARRGLAASDAAIAREIGGARAVVFEGAQGVLLDEWAGFHPHTTWSTCTFARPLELLREAGVDEADVRRVGVLRAYAVRHGAGPFPTESPELASRLPEPDNAHGPWQGHFRVGWLDFVLARYARDVVGGLDALAVTHLDALPRLAPLRVCRAYAAEEGASFAGWARDGDGQLVAPPPPMGHDLDRQEQTGRDLARVQPVWTPLDAARLVPLLEAELGAPVAIASSGPSTRDVRFRVEDTL